MKGTWWVSFFKSLVFLRWVSRQLSKIFSFYPLQFDTQPEEAQGVLFWKLAAFAVLFLLCSRCTLCILTLLSANCGPAMYSLSSSRNVFESCCGVMGEMTRALAACPFCLFQKYFAFAVKIKSGKSTKHNKINTFHSFIYSFMSFHDAWKWSQTSESKWLVKKVKQLPKQARRCFTGWLEPK